jgi:hypothetical protein
MVPNESFNGFLDGAGAYVRVRGGEAQFDEVLQIVL